MARSTVEGEPSPLAVAFDEPELISLAFIEDGASPQPLVRPQTDAAETRLKPLLDTLASLDVGQMKEQANKLKARFSPDKPISLEEILAGKWMSWVGAIAVVLGVGFFFKYPWRSS